MKRTLALLLILALSLSMILSLVSCSSTGLKISEDGYLVIDGEKTNILAKTDGGEEGSASNSPTNTQTATTPQLMINPFTNEWMVSYDNGVTWTSLGVKATGEKGDAGAPGEKGESGNDGKSSYELAVQLGYTGTLDQWLASLIGEAGPAGATGAAGASIDTIVFDEATSSLIVTLTDGTVLDPISITVAHTHTFGEVRDLIDNNDDLPCDKRVYCSSCSTCNEIVLFLGTAADHEASDEYSSDSYHHWCACVKCGYEMHEEEHSWLFEYKSNYNYHYASCSVCNAYLTSGHIYDDNGQCTVCDFYSDFSSVNLKQAQYNTTTTYMPSNWNELTYADNNDTQIMSYIGSSFFDYDYKFANDEKFNEDGTINKGAIVEGAYTTNYSAATNLEDVTASVDAKWGYTDAQKAEGGYAWKITLRRDLKWDDGTAITAEDFVYSMQQQLDPNFMNFRANTYYDTLRMKGAKAYFFQNQEGIYESVASLSYASLDEAIADGKVIYIDSQALWGTNSTYVDANGNPCPRWLAYNDETIYTGEYNGVPDSVSGTVLWDYKSYIEVGGSYESASAIFVENTVRDFKWEDVGIYADGEYSIVVCFDESYDFIKEDGTLSYKAVEYMSRLPLVHKAKYEASKKAPKNGATLWTSNYNSSLETTASWGPYKLTQFEAGSHYKLEKNEHWYGWNMIQYASQYNISAIYCEKVEEWTTQWMGFLRGKYDDGSLQNENATEYLDSKYVYYTSTSTGTFGMQLFSDLSVLKNSENNNGILAIREFRQALNLALDRSDIVEKIWPGSATPCFGLLNPAYYYDIENSPTLEDGGQYRNTVQAKEGILRAYGFTQGADGKWSSGDLKNLSLDEAYGTLTGFNPTLAKEKMAEAIAILLTDPETYGYDATKYIYLVYGSSTDTAKQRFCAEYLQGRIDELIKGTPLEGKIKVKFDASAGAMWAEAFRSGKTQIGFGYGFSGNAFNPFDIVGAFVNPDDNLNYHQYWDTSAVNMTLTMPAGDYEGAGEIITMSVQNWYYCLNGLAADEKQAKTYNWGAGFAPAEARLTILSALEELVIKESRSIMLIAESYGIFLGAKFSYISDVENVFMGFGGIRYMEVNYTDAEWAAFVASQGNDLSTEYKKTN